MHKERFVCIEWLDASFTSGYYDKDDPRRFLQIPSQTVGHLVKRDRSQVLVATDRFFLSDGTADLRHISTIPKKMITKIRYLKDKE